MLASGERRDPRHRPDHGQPALAASVGDAKDVKDGRQFAAWLGVSKRGDGYLGKLLVHGVRAGIRVSGKKADGDESWIQRLVGRRNKNIAAVALANKNARIAWALLAHATDCAGNHDMMARQARPWRGQPIQGKGRQSPRD